MRLLVRGDALEVLVERVFGTGRREVGLGVVLETLLVEASFQVLQSQCIVKNVG